MNLTYEITTIILSWIEVRNGRGRGECTGEEKNAPIALPCRRPLQIDVKAAYHQ